jgi:hypothetical protein
MSVTKTFTVTVANPGAGNRYYIDGVLQETVNLIEGNTYRFDVSNGSVSGHPFKFSTTSNGTHGGGSEYTTGVTTSGNPGDNGAYVQIVVAIGAPQLYYYCQYHSGMGGQANTVDSSVIRVLTVTVANPGAGNRYYIDGVLQETVNLAEGYTYRFDQSAGSNGGHPFKFSTTSNGTHSGGSEYTTGVTYNGTPGNPGAYTQIAVAASAPQLYYYCQYHSGMGGQANTVDSDTWGVLKWNENSWGSQNSVPVLLTGLSATSTVGSIDPFNEIGWGRDTWGFENWGESAIDVILPSLSATASVNLPLESIITKPGWGTLDWGENGWGTVESAVFNLTGLSATSSVGTLTVVDTSIGLSGLAATSSLGSLTAFSDNTLALPALSLTSSLGLLSVDAHSVGLPALSATSAVGSITPADVIGLTGLSSQTAVGSITISSNPVTALTGVSATSVVGSLTVSNITGAILTGQSATSAVGSLTTTQLSIASLNGLGLTATTGVGNLTTTGYKNIDITGNTSYTDVTHVA